jgi:hypothetical protein
VIGVALSPGCHETVSEFFELFKTPWEYFDDTKPYDVVICRSEPPRGCDALLVIVIATGADVLGEAGRGAGRPAVLLRAQEITFPVYAGASRVDRGSPLINNEGNGECVGSYECSGGCQTLYLGYDFFEETRYLLTHGQPQAYGSWPTLDIHISNLRAWILAAGSSLVEIPPVAHGSRFFACLTHDVDFAGIRYHKFDQTVLGFVYRALFKSVRKLLGAELSPRMLLRNWAAVVKLPLVQAGLLRDFWDTFGEYRRIEEDRASTFFFVPFKGEAGRLDGRSAPAIRAVKYDVSSLREQIEDLLSRGCEVGVHGIDSWDDIDKGRAEIGRIKELTGVGDLGVRMHWLYFGPASPEKLEQAGYSFDSTSGYNEQIGFKAGTTQVYKPPGATELLELPMHIMDTALLYPSRMALTISESKAAIRVMFETTARFGGVVTLNWHDRSLAPERLWDGVYRWVLSELDDRGALVVRAGDAVAWFRKRRSIVFRRKEQGAKEVVAASTLLEVVPADRMVIRVYLPGKVSRLGEAAFSELPSYQDFLLGEEKEIDVDRLIPSRTVQAAARA